MSNVSPYVNLNGRIIPAVDAAVYPGQAGLYYGAGCFETFRADQSRIFEFEEHIKRLKAGLTYIGAAKDQLPDAESLLQEIHELLEANRLAQKSARVRIQYSLDERQGYQTTEANLIKFITAAKLDPPPLSVSLVTVKTKVIPSACKPSVFKTSNMLNYRQAYREAQAKGADDGLMFSVGNFVAETSIANIFWRREGRIFTPSEECDILPGIMRNALLEILRNEGIIVQEGTFSRPEIEMADLIWITNSVAELAAVKRLDDITYPAEDTLLEELRHELNHTKSEQIN